MFSDIAVKTKDINGKKLQDPVKAKKGIPLPILLGETLESSKKLHRGLEIYDDSTTVANTFARSEDTYTDSY